MSDTLSEFEQVVMVALGHLEGEQHVAAIHEEILRRTGRDVAVTAIYVTLGRLEKKGYVTVGSETGSAVRSGQGRKVADVTPEGRASLARTRRFLDRLWRDVDFGTAEETR